MKYIYKAIDGAKIITGKIEDDNIEKVYEFLKTRNFIIISVHKDSSFFSDIITPFSEHVSFNDVVDLTRQLAIMFNAGLTILESLTILKKQMAKPALVKLVNEIDNDIRAGYALSKALEKHSKIFSNLYISLVKAGEASGKLDEILLKLADNLEKERSFRTKMKGVLVYPAIIITGMVIVMFIMITFVMPKLLSLYKDFDVELPFTTKFMIALSGFFQSYWIVIAVFFIGGYFALFKYVRTSVGKKMRDKFILKIPVLKRVVSIAILSDTTRTLSILIGAGVSILQSLDIVADTADNTVYQEAFKQIYSRIEKGESLGKTFEDAGIFPPILVQMTTVGEQTGHLDDTLLRISRYFEMESELAIKALTTLIEPLILVILGLGVGFVIFSVITPIYNLTSSIK